MGVMGRKRLGALVVSAMVSALSGVPAGPATASLAWGDDPCEEYGGQVAVAPDGSVTPADDHPRAYVACADGSLLYHGIRGKGTNEKIRGVEADLFVDLAATTGAAMYAVTWDGRVRALGGEHHGQLHDGAGVVALEVTPSEHGYWIVTERGRVAGFGDARSLRPAEDTEVSAPVVAFAASGGEGGWLVTAAGEVVPVGDAPDHGSVTGRVADGDRVTGIVTDRRTGGFWVTTRHGAILESGGAPAEPDAEKCLAQPGAQPPFAGAVGDPGPNATAPLWTYSVNGGICGFDPHG